MQPDKHAQSQYYSSIINNSTGNSKQLFSTINHLLKPQSPLHSDSTEKQCSNFAAFFKNKVDTIRSILSSPSAPPVPTADPQPGTTQPLHCFTDISQQEVEGIVRRMKPSTCVLDPLPSALVKSYICTLSPMITKIANLSLQSGHVPSALKTAVIKPRLKKPSLDPGVLAN